MATIDLTKETLDSLKQIQELAMSGFGMGEASQKVSEFEDRLKQMIKDHVPHAIEMLKKFEDGAKKAFEEGSKTVVEYTENLLGLNGTTEENIESLKKMGVAMLALHTAMNMGAPEGFNKIGESASANSSKIAEMVANIQKLSPEIAKMPVMKQMLGAVGKAGPSIDSAKFAEQGLMQSAAASGQFNEMLKSMGGNLTGLDNKLESYSNEMLQVALSSGAGSKEIAGVFQELSKIPGALDNFGGKTGLVIDGMNHMAAAMKVAYGTGQSLTDVTGMLTNQYQNFGTKGKTALEEVARMASVASDVGLPINTMRDAVEKSAASFKLFGDNTEGAISILGRFGQAFKDSNLGPEGIKEVVSGITNGIANMDTASKAFLSGRTGGASGLQGAAQIDLALKQGNLDDVYKKVEENLRKSMGGKLVTVEQAATNQMDAGQYQKEKMMLQSKAFGGIAKDDASAMRIIEAMASGKTKDIGKLSTPDKALETAIQTGNKFEERQVNILTIANAYAQRTSELSSIIAYNTARNLAGNQGGFSGYIHNLKKDTDLAGQMMGPITGKGNRAGKNAEEAVEDEGKKIMGWMSGLKSIVGTKKKTTEEGEQEQTVNTTAPSITAAHTNSIAKHIMNQPTPTHTQMTKQIVNPTHTAGNQTAGKQSTQGTNQPTSGKEMNINVTTVCSGCMKKQTESIASKLFENLFHRHEASESQAITTGHGGSQ